jgi:hypothetical protein
MRVSTSVAMLFMLAAAAPLSAQSSERVSNDSTTTTVNTTAVQPTIEREATTSSPSTGASVTGLRAGVHARETARPMQPTMAAVGSGNLGQARAMMVVGVAALITGAIIGGQPGTFIMVGGAVIGLVGLYDYLQ